VNWNLITVAILYFVTVYQYNNGASIQQLLMSIFTLQLIDYVFKEYQRRERD
jgi:uncharacterized membrane protein